MNLEKEIVGGVFTYRSLVNQFYEWLMTTCTDDSGNLFACPGQDFGTFICETAGYTSSTSTTTEITTSTSTTTTTQTTTATTSGSARIAIYQNQAGIPDPSNRGFSGPGSISTITLTMSVNLTVPGSCPEVLTFQISLTGPDGTTAANLYLPVDECVPAGYPPGSTQNITGSTSIQSYNSSLSVFIGKAATGIWQLSVYNDTLALGAINSWTLTFT
jgi:hypothetical protein